MTVEKLNQYINGRISGMQEAFDKALEEFDRNIIQISRRINVAATKAEKDIDHAIWSTSEKELPFEDQNIMVLQYQQLISKMRMDAVDILIAKNGGKII